MFHKLSADHIFTGKEMLDSGHVLLVTEKGGIEGIVTGEEAGEDVMRYPGMLAPGFVNCHCHLDLSHLRGAIPQKTGLVEFVMHVMKLRDSAAQEKKQEAMEAALKEMEEGGIVAVGDICSGDVSIEAKRNSSLQWIHFIEVTGFLDFNAASRLSSAESVLEKFRKELPGQRSVISPHAPYSVSAGLMDLINERTAGEIISIHNQECRDENQFFREGSGGFLKLYKDLGIDISGFHPPGTSSLEAWLSRFDRRQQIISVHNSFTEPNDIEYTKHDRPGRPGLFFCLCPRANLYIEDCLPPVKLLMEKEVPIVLGTDSLASNEGLSILEEMKVLRRQAGVPVERLLQWATLAGAKALGLDNELGSFEKSKKPGVLWLRNVGPEIPEDASVERLF